MVVFVVLGHVCGRKEGVGGCVGRKREDFTPSYCLFFPPMVNQKSQLVVMFSHAGRSKEKIIGVKRELAQQAVDFLGEINWI